MIIMNLWKNFKTALKELCDGSGDDHIRLVQHKRAIAVSIIVCIITILSVTIFVIKYTIDMQKSAYDAECNKIEIFEYGDHKAINTYSKVVFDDIDHIEESDNQIIIYLKEREW